MWLCGTSTNLSKPEKDPKAIAAARNLPASNYPRCLLCAENEGYADRVNHPARQNHRVVPITINGSPWFLQYSSYVYYNEHCICFNREHIPMKIDRACFGKLLDFVGQLPTTSWAPTPTCPSWAALSWPTTTSRAGGTPTARDRETASRMGYEAVNALLADKGNRIIGTRDGRITDMDMEEALALVKNLEMYRYEVLEALTAKGK